MAENAAHPIAAIATAIGQFIQNFNGLEERLISVLGVLLNSEDVARGEVVGAALMFRDKCKLVNALVIYVGGPEIAKEFKALNARLVRINEVRNDLVHGEQWLDFEGVMRQRRARLNEKKGYSPKHTEYTPDEVTKWAAETEELEVDLWKFVRDWFERNKPAIPTE